jgi:hypothetical protein
MAGAGAILDATRGNAAASSGGAIGGSAVLAWPPLADWTVTVAGALANAKRNAPVA